MGRGKHRRVSYWILFVSFIHCNIVGITSFSMFSRYKERKKVIQERIHDRLKVRVDQVLQGFGTTNNGNIARTCFDSPELFAEALELNEDLVRKSAIILIAFRHKAGFPIAKMRELCTEVYKLHYRHYLWALMSPSVNKLLCHGCDIAEKFPLPPAY